MPYLEDPAAVGIFQAVAHAVFLFERFVLLEFAADIARYLKLRFK